MKKLIKSPLPGKLIEYQVKRGEKVAKGDVVAIIESMKMYNEILAEDEGEVTRLIAFPNSHIPVNGELLEIN